MYQITEKRRKTENKYNAKKLKEHGESIVASNIFKGSVLRFIAVCLISYTAAHETHYSQRAGSALVLKRYVM